MTPAARWIGLAALALLLIAPAPILAQDGLLQSYIAEDGSFWFSHPRSWQVEVRDGLVYVYNSRVTVSVVGPGVLETLGLGGYTDPAALAQALAARLDIQGGEVILTEQNGRPAARLNFTDAEGQPAFLLAMLLRDNRLGLVEVRYTGGYRPLSEQFALRIARSLEVPPGPPARLFHYGESWREVLAELEAAGAIPAGGRLLFQASSPYTAEQTTAATYTLLGSRQPATSVILAAWLRFTPGATDGYQACFVGTRIVASAEEPIVQAYLDVGVNSADQIYYLDSTGDPATSRAEALPRRVMDGAPHHLLFLALEQTLTVYLDGERVFASVPVEARAGISGLGVISPAAGARCQAEDIWLYEVTGTAASVCGVTVAETPVNQRLFPTTSAGIAGQLSRDEIRGVTGQTTDAQGYVWWRLDDGTWVRGDVVIEQGDCSGVAVVAP